MDQPNQSPHLNPAAFHLTRVYGSLATGGRCASALGGSLWQTRQVTVSWVIGSIARNRIEIMNNFYARSVFFVKDAERSLTPSAAP
jgi:hypothetical protein